MDGPLQKITEEQLDFLKELVNIGAGNAVTALEQILQCRVDLQMPSVKFLPACEVASYLAGSPAAPVIGVRMDLIGDITGSLYVIISQNELENIAILIKNIPHDPIENEEAEILASIAEIGNVLAGVYLSAIHDFCSLTIYHTIPRVAVDMVQSILDETLAESGGISPDIFIFVNEFATKSRSFKMYMLLIPIPDSFDRLSGSLNAARGGLRIL